MIEFVSVDMFINTVVIASGIDIREFDLLYYDNHTKFTDEEYRLIANDIKNENSCAGMTMQLDCGNIFVFIRKGHERRDLTVIHELHHAANKLLQRAGVNHDGDDETYAYLTAWLVNEYYNRLDDYEKK